MSDNLASLRRKLDGAAKLGSVVRAMKATAAAAIGQYEAANLALGSYRHCVELALGVCLREAEAHAVHSGRTDAPLLGAIVFGSDQGLVGRFNEVIAEFAIRTLAPLPGAKTVWAVGERVCAHLSDAGLTVAKQLAVPASVAAITPLVGQLQILSEALRDHGEAARILVFHNRPRSAALYEPVAGNLLPFDAQWRRRLIALRWPAGSLPELLDGVPVTLHSLVHEYLFISLYEACAESLASENGSRLAAMQRAQKNIETVCTDLGRAFNRLRQSSIDEELFDVLCGFNALS